MSEKNLNQHTPGPWFVQRSDYGNLLVKPVPGQVVCDIEQLPEELENARLISAAPDLLEALEKMVLRFDHIGLRGLVLNAKEHGWTKDHVNLQLAAIKQAQEAIKKAKGES